MAKYITDTYCNLCNSSLKADEIPLDVAHTYAGDFDEEGKKYFSQRIGIEDPYRYDGTLYWKCPHCEALEHRFTGEITQHDTVECGGVGHE